jgi:sigma-B regulation protein RsbU (phosphoserine phosphatase)
MFGKDRLRDVIRANAQRSAAGISAAIQDAVRHHRGGAEQTDDLTLVVIKTTGGADATRGDD